MVAPGPSFAAALVAGLRRHGTRPASPGGLGWAVVADEARQLALGLGAVGAGAATRIRVADPTLGPVARLTRELAVLASGGVLVTGEGGGHDAALSAEALELGATSRPLAEVRAAGRAAAEASADAHEVALAALDAATPALATPGGVVSHAQALWALRSVAAWLGPSLGGGPTTVLAVTGPDDPPGLALLARWYPALSGAALADPPAPGDVAGAVRRHRPDLLVLDPTGWRVLADGVRASARSRRAAAALRSGRVVAAGEPEGPVSAALGRAARHRARARLVDGSGLDAVGAGVCVGVLGPVDASDLAAAAVPVASTWIDPAVPGPVAATAFARPDGDWGRPLPGRSVSVGEATVVLGGDVAPEGVALAGRVRIDGRGRVDLGGAR